MKKKPGRKDQRRLAKQNRLEEQKKARIQAKMQVKKARRQGLEPDTPMKRSTPITIKQNPRWFNRRKKVMMTRTWAKPNKVS